MPLDNFFNFETSLIIFLQFIVMKMIVSGKEDSEQSQITSYIGYF